MIHSTTIWFAVPCLVMLCLPSAGRAIDLIDYNSISPYGSAIHFGDVPIGTQAPVYQVGDVTVSFGTHFEGQQLGHEPNTLVDSTPNGPLTLGTSGPTVATSVDLAHRDITLGGYDAGSYFTTPISILFDQAVAEVGFVAGHFQEPHVVIIEAYDAQGQSLGSMRNPDRANLALGFTSEGTNQISGMTLYIEPGEMDWEGFTIDDLIFSLKEGEPGSEVLSEPGPDEGGETPEPATFVIWALLGLVGLAGKKSQKVRRTRY